jgi:O-antigen/teichoic acid export membrane protein
VGVLLNSLARVPYSLLQALGRPDLTAKIHFVELPLHLVLAWFFVDAWGVTGAALAWSVRVGVDAALLFVVVARRSGLPLHAFILPRARLGAVGIVMSGAAVALLLETVNVMWVRLAALPILGLAMAAALWRYLLDGRERERIRELLHMVLSFSRRRAPVGKA